MGKFAVYGDLFSFGYEFLDNLSGFPPSNNSVPLGLVYWFSFVVFVTVISSDSQIC